MDDFLESAEPRVIGLMLATIVFLVTTLLVMYLLWPQFKEYRELNNSHQILMQAAGNQDGLEQQLQTTQSEVEKLSYRLHGDMAGLPDKQMESYIIGRLQKISWNSGVELASVVPGQGQQVQMFQEMLFDVRINASYFNFFNWLQSINEELGYIVVKRFEISPQRGRDEAKPKLSINLTLVSYRMVSDA